MSMDRLIEAIAEKQNPTVAGLDPKLSYIPENIRQEAFEKYGKNLDGAAAAILAYNKGLIDALYDIVPAIKPQCAYYEMYGWQGMKTLQETIAYAKEKGMFVITDGKRHWDHNGSLCGGTFGDNRRGWRRDRGVWRGCFDRQRVFGFGRRPAGGECLQKAG